MFILVISYIREYLHVFTKLFTGTRVSKDFQIWLSGSRNTKNDNTQPYTYTHVYVHVHRLGVRMCLKPFFHCLYITSYSFLFVWRGWWIKDLGKGMSVCDREVNKVLTIGIYSVMIFTTEVVIAFEEGGSRKRITDLHVHVCTRMCFVWHPPSPPPLLSCAYAYRQVHVRHYLCVPVVHVASVDGMCSISQYNIGLWHSMIPHSSFRKSCGAPAQNYSRMTCGEISPQSFSTRRVFPSSPNMLRISLGKVSDYVWSEHNGRTSMVRIILKMTMCKIGNHQNIFW